MNIFLIVFLVNFITSLIARAIWGGRVIIKGPKISNKDRVFLLAGMLKQPEVAFEYIYFTEYEKVCLRYSVFGFNPKSIADQLDNNMVHGDIVCGISIGAKPIAYSTTNTFKHILINPCTHPETLKTKYFWLIRIFTPLAMLITYLIGWLAIVPIKNEYSLALLIDQLYWMGYGCPGYAGDENRHKKELGDLSNTGIVISADDEYLENSVITEIYRDGTWIEIQTHHGYTENIYAAQLYNEAIEILLD